MSCYESLRGEGILKKKDIQELKKILITAYNNDVDRANALLKKECEEEGKKFMKKDEFKKATSRTNSFGLFDRVYEAGNISLDIKTGTLDFYIEDNNRSVECVESFSKAFKVFENFIEKLPEKSKYGVKTYYENEYDEYDGTWRYYGGYKNTKMHSHF